MKMIAQMMLAMGVLGLLTAGAMAKRLAPKDVPPVTHKGVIYSAPHDHMGSVAAKEEKTGKELWIKQIYTVKYDKEMETDVQDCFITKLSVEKDLLLIENEREHQYEMDLSTQTVKVLKGSAVIEKGK